MNVWSIVVAIVTAILCGAAARRIAVAKGLDPSGYSALGFFVGPIGLAIAAFRSPMHDGPEEERPDKLAWWADDTRTRPWVTLAAIGTAASVGLAIAAAHQPGQFSGDSLEPQIETFLASQGAPGATVDCPSDYPGKSGYTFLCTATDNTGTVHVEVTVLNDKGEVNWVVIG